MLGESTLAEILACVDLRLDAAERLRHLLRALKKCPFCDELSPPGYKLGSHILSAHAGEMIQGEVPSGSGRDIDAGAGRIFICPHCQYAIGRESEYRAMNRIVRHVEHCELNDTRVHGLPRVAIRFSNDPELIRSLISRTGISLTYACHLCQHELYGSQAALASHYAQAHTDVIESDLPAALLDSLRAESQESQPQDAVQLAPVRLQAYPDAASHLGDRDCKSAELALGAEPTCEPRGAGQAGVLAIVAGLLGRAESGIHVWDLHREVSASHPVTIPQLRELLLSREGMLFSQSRPDFWKLIKSERALVLPDDASPGDMPGSNWVSARSQGAGTLRPDVVQGVDLSCRNHDGQLVLDSGAEQAIVDPASDRQAASHARSDAHSGYSEEGQALDAETTWRPDHAPTPPEDMELEQHLAPADARRWYVSNRGNDGFNGPVDLETLRRWARGNLLGPGDLIVVDGSDPFPARELVDLEMVAFVQLLDGRVHGPVNPDAAAKLLSQGLLKRVPDDLEVARAGEVPLPRAAGRGMLECLLRLIHRG